MFGLINNDGLYKSKLMQINGVLQERRSNGVVTNQGATHPEKYVYNNHFFR